MMTQETDTLLSLLKASLWENVPEIGKREHIDWNAIIETARKQGILAVVFDSLELLPKESVPSSNLLLKWFGKVSYMVSLYDTHRNVISHLGHFYDSLSIKLMILKGYGLSLYYPVPNHRPVGDIDSYNFGMQDSADRLMREKLGIKIDNSHHHHTVFQFEGVTVENHYDFINTHGHKTSAEFEARLKELSQNPCDEIVLDGVTIYLPHPNFNALFLVRHCAGHFRSTELTLRQLLDWLLFVKKEHDRIDWNGLYSFLERMNLHRFANCLNAIGVDYLGFDSSLFPQIESDKKLVERVLNDILSPEFVEKENGTLLSGLWVKPRRWWHNRWKQKICFPDSLLSDFLYQLHAKFLKPAHFRH